ncbi:hypothetical protein N6H14_23440 [Paenibacillus sp. CC-CFT747]|nr:hypothetical protein N6H14_23440 [Paenibacillus sp. CC-CFT747]
MPKTKQQTGGEDDPKRTEDLSAHERHGFHLSKGSQMPSDVNEKGQIDDGSSGDDVWS